MLVQQLQRPTRLLALLTSACLVILCFRYLGRVNFNSSCNGLDLRYGGDRDMDGKFGKTRLLNGKPAMVPKGPLARIAKVGVAVNHLNIPVVHRAFKTHQVHNEIHGYPHYIADREVVSAMTDNDHFGRGSGTYTKPAYLLAIIIEELLKPEEERLEWIFWFDGDTAILNPSTPLEVFLPPNSSSTLNDVHLMMASNWDGLNSGVFALRVHKWTASMLSAVLAYPIYEKERTMHDRFRDQSAFQFLLTNPDSPLATGHLKNREHWAQVPMRWYNSFPVNNAFYAKGGWLFSHNMTAEMFDNGTTKVFDDGYGGKINPWKVMQGDLVVHFAGTSGVRDSWMSPWLDRAEALLPEWNNPNTTKSLEIEVAQYWRDYETKIKEMKEDAKKAEAEAKKKKAEQDRQRMEAKTKKEEWERVEKKKEEEAAKKKKEEAAAKKKEEEEAAKKKEEEEAAKKKEEEAAAAEKEEEETASSPETSSDSSSSSSPSEEKPLSDEADSNDSSSSA